jgi:hypothetical protein
VLFGGFSRLEIEGGGIDAIAKSGRPRTVVEDVAEVGVTTRAQDLGAMHQR